VKKMLYNESQDDQNISKREVLRGENAAMLQLAIIATFNQYCASTIAEK
jgi:hypothetical protein